MADIREIDGEAPACLDAPCHMVFAWTVGGGEGPTRGPMPFAQACEAAREMAQRGMRAEVVGPSHRVIAAGARGAAVLYDVDGRSA